MNAALGDVKPRTVPVLFVVDGSFDEIYDAGCPRGVLLGINLPILLAMVRHECCFTVQNPADWCSVWTGIVIL